MWITIAPFVTVLDNFPVDPNILTQLQQNLPIIKEQMKAENHQPILLVTPQLRPLISRYARLFWVKCAVV
ncbi:flagellar biosynthesis FlhA domain protein [Yersinia pestis]|nr:flagellar biosynthesis FlhA domain protein [Yersinia pestis]